MGGKTETTKMTKPQFEGFDAKDVPWWTSKRFLLAIICFFGFGNLYAQRVNLSMSIVCMVNHTATDVHITDDHSTGYLEKYYTYSGHHNDTGYSHINTPTTGAPVESAEKCPYHGHSENETASLSEHIIGGGNQSTRSEPPTFEELCWRTFPTYDICYIDEAHDIFNELRQGTLVWSKRIQGLLLGSFFWGYLFPQIPGGWLSEKFGAKKVIAIGMFPVAVLTLLTPVSAYASPWLLLVVRILIGVGEAVMYPAAQALFSRWAAPWERSRLIGISYAGGQLGNAIAFPVAGLLCEYGFGGGWPSIFYVFGACGFIWCVVWTIFVHDSPAECPGITDIERKYVEQALGQNQKQNRKKPATPWKSIFTSSAVWAIIVAHTCGNWGAYLILTSIPAYMKEVLKFDIKKNGLFSMLPYLAFWLCINIGGTAADFLIERKILSVVWTRKLLDTIGLVMPGTLMVVTGFMSCNQSSAAVALLVLTMGFSGFQFAAHFVNHGDIAPSFAGTLFGISNVAATIPGILTPYIVGAVTTEKTREQWLTVFYISGAVHMFGALFYLIFARGEIQPWAVVSAGDANHTENADALLEKGTEAKDKNDKSVKELDTELKLLDGKTSKSNV